jgi:hypothetical protein
MSKRHQTLALPVELLSVTVAKISGLPKILLTMRLDVECFESTNLALTPEQGFRLLRDLTERFKSSKLLEGFEPPKEVGKEVLIQIMKSQDEENTDE